MDDSTSVSIPEFVIQEAKEKSFEIEVKSLKQFEREKNTIVEVEQDKIQNLYEEKLKQQEMDFKIKRSTSINRSRLEKMEARNRAMMKVFSDAQYQLYKKIRSEPQFYKNLLIRLIAQGLIKIYEKKVKIRCLQKDIKLVQECVPQAKKMFQDLIKLELEKEIEVDIEIDQNKCLEEREIRDNSGQAVEQYDLETGRQEVILKNEDDQKCFGGVVLCNEEGNIICKNTFDVRVDLCFQDSLPDMRFIMFPPKK